MTERGREEEGRGEEGRARPNERGREKEKEECIISEMCQRV